MLTKESQYLAGIFNATSRIVLSNDFLSIDDPSKCGKQIFSVVSIILIDLRHRLKMLLLEVRSILLNLSALIPKKVREAININCSNRA